MANALYTLTRAKFLQATVDMTGTIKLSLIDHGTDTPNTSTDDFYDDIEAGLVGSASGAFANKTYTDGVFDADDVTVSTVSGATVESVNIWQDTAGASSADPLIAYIDTATGLPVTPNGGDITVAWDSGSNKIFKL